MYFDTHSHLTLCHHLSLKQQHQLFIENNISHILDPGLWVKDFLPRYQLLKNTGMDFFNRIYLGIAIAPHTIKPLEATFAKYINKTTYAQIEQDLAPFLEELEELLQQREKFKIKALSEIGLDFHYTHDLINHRVQEVLLFKQLEFAQKYQLPVFLHIREAYTKTFAIVKQSGVKKGVVHCFTGNRDDAEHFLDWGFHLSFSGIVTFKNAQELKEIAKQTPNHRILTETDSPYLAPHPLRGQKNNSSNIIHTNRYIADLKTIDETEMNQILMNNAKRILSI